MAGSLGLVWRVLALVPVAVMCGAVSAPAQVTERLIAQERGDTLVAAYGGWLVWSSYDPGAQSWRLVGRAPGSEATEDLAVSPRPMPFDADLGPDARGRVTAVYSRCAREPVAFLGGFPSFRHRYGRGCRIVMLDLATRLETRLYERAGASLIYPTLWRDRLAYVVRGRLNDHLHLEQRVRRNSRTRTTNLGRAPAERTEDPYAGPLRLDLYGKNLAFAWETEVGRCPGPPDLIDGRGPYTVTRVYLQRGSQLRTLLDKGCSAEMRPGAVASAEAVTVSAGVVSWLRSTATRGPVVAVSIRRRSLATGRVTDTRLRQRYDSLAADGQAVYAADRRVLALGLG